MIKTYTISKTWADQEILFKDPETNEIHLKPGVHRKNYGDWINPNKLESHINSMELNMKKMQQRVEELGINQTIEESYE